MSTPGFNRTTLRVFAMLDALSKSGQEGLGVTELASLIGAEKSTTSRTLATLESIRAVEHDAYGRFRVGILLFELGMSFLNRIDLRSRASAALRELVEATGETVHLGIPDREHVIYVEKLEGTNALQMRSRVGTRMPLYSTGLGKAILAFAENSAAQAVAAKPLKQRTPNTITSTAELNRELERVRERGYAFDFEENEVGIRCVGVPIFDYSGQVVAGVSVAGPAFQFTEERLDELAHLACRTAADISTELGWVGADTESRREATST